jgi:hypothetical protein
MCVLVNSRFVENPLRWYCMTPVILRWGCYTFCQSALQRTRLEVESPARHQWVHSVCCAVMMARIFPCLRYNLYTPSAEGGGNVSRSAAVVPTFWLALAKAGHWPPSRLMAGATHLAWAWVAARSTMRILSTSSMGMCRGVSYSWAMVTACLSANLLRYCATSCKLLAYWCDIPPLTKDG